MAEDKANAAPTTNAAGPLVSSGSPYFASLEPARRAMGDKLRLAREMELAEMEPRGDLSSTEYALANPGEEYLVLQPDETAGPFAAHAYSVLWHSVGSCEMKDADQVTVENPGGVTFEAPFAWAAPAVLHLKGVPEKSRKVNNAPGTRPRSQAAPGFGAKGE